MKTEVIRKENLAEPLTPSPQTPVRIRSLRKNDPPESSRKPSPRKDDSEPLPLSPVVPVIKDESELHLEPAKQSANSEFYSKLVSGLRNITTPEPEQAKEVADHDMYRKYSHHLGRAEFGTLRKRDSTQSG